MKRLFLFILTIYLAFSLISCNTSISGNSFTIADMEEIFQKNDRDIIFTVKESGTGYTFSFEENDYVVNYKITGEATADKTVKHISITHYEIKESLARDYNGLISTIERTTADPGKMTGNEAKILRALSDILEIYSMISGTDNITDSTMEEILSLLCYGTTIRINGWSISCTIADQEIRILAKK